jgi:hypothetical protein
MNLRHPVVITLVFAIVLVLIGIYFVERQRAVTPSGGSDSFGAINGGYVSPASVSPDSSGNTNLPNSQASTNTGPDTLVIPAATPTPVKTPTKAVADGAFDYNALLASLKQDRTTPSAQANSTYEQLVDAFSFTPTIKTPEPKVKTAEQQAIFVYGNTVGARLQGFAAVNPNMTQTLQDQIKNRADERLGNAVRDLGGRYRALGESILAIQEVPTAVRSTHESLGQSYINLGEALAQVPDATDDKAFIAAITTYNSKADAFTGAFIGMVTLFSALDVTFESSDAGSVFSFRH